jgi:hypothetical protein
MVLVTPEKIASIMALAPVPHSFAELDALVSVVSQSFSKSGTMHGF